MKGRRHSWCALAAAALIACFGAQIPWAQVTPVTQSLAPTSGCLFGVYNKPGKLQRQQALLNLESQVGRRFGIDRMFYLWDDPIPTDYDAWNVQQGRVVFLSWKPIKRDGTVILWNSIAAGDEDTTIAARAAAFRQFDGRVMLAFHHEPENDPANGKAADFRSAFRHVVQVFRGAGVTNVEWVMILTHKTYASGHPDNWYPGDDVIDWIGGDGYNWYLSESQPDAPWTSFSDIFTPLHAWGMTHAKPLVVAEYGCQEDPALAGRKGAWFDEAAATLKSWPEVKAVTYMNYNDSAYHWWVQSSDSALAAFGRMGADPYFNSGVRNACGPTWNTYQ